MIENETSRRFPAEWEPQAAVQLTLPHEGTDWVEMLEEVMPCFVKIAEEIAAFEPVIIVCKQIEQAKNWFKNVPPGQISFFECATNDTWARDHGGITVVENNHWVILDFVFNGWGLKFPADKDNLITGKMHQSGFFAANYQHGGMVLEGGALETDGNGTLLTTSECLLSPNRNPHWNLAETENALRQKLGVNHILWLHDGYLAGDDTDSHIDTLARFCNPDTIAYVRCPDPDDEHYQALSSMETTLKSFTKINGEPYNLVPLPWPDACFDAEGNRLPATYANFLVINGAVLVPTYQVSQDSEALDIFKRLFPDRKIIGVDCRPLIEQHGSLHCVTMQFPAGSLNLKP
ncbi:MAG: agmatine deiminase family protein [Saprospiraceae bacterium]|nr:agmatine deiminase family protein [Saprospiraceae bacterium]